MNDGRRLPFDVLTGRSAVRVLLPEKNEPKRIRDRTQSDSDQQALSLLSQDVTNDHGHVLQPALEHDIRRSTSENHQPQSAYHSAT